MADNSQQDLEPEKTKGYNTPQTKKLEEIVNQDQGDESLANYKKVLLGDAAQSGDNNIIPFPEDPRQVIVSKLAILVAGRPDIEIQLTGDASNLKDQSIVLKEGVTYRVKIYYYVQREIVCGLKYIMATYRGPLKVAKEDTMLGSYAPRSEVYSWSSEEEEAPKGAMARGSYLVKSRFTDDDKSDILTWQWTLKIKKDWNSTEED